MKKFTIPIFIPELACPFQCLYCNQKKISGSINIPNSQEISEMIEDYLKTMPQESAHIEIGFFGGNFTGISCEDQQHYLELAQPFLLSKRVQSIRISTRPDYIDLERLNLLKRYGVETIELGAQSMDDEILLNSGRGHLSEDVEVAAKLILENGFKLGLQMMIGLPGDDKKKAIATANQIIKLGADNTRIYPCLVIKDTKLAEYYQDGSYNPLSLEEAIDWTTEILQLFENAKVKVLRVGLHPSEGLISGDDLLGGPFHSSFKELVLSNIWLRKFKKIEPKAESIEVFVGSKQLNHAIGYNSSNKNYLQSQYKSVKFKLDETLKNRDFYVNYC